MGENQQIEDIIQAKLNKVLLWLRNPYNLALVGVLLLAFGIRLYYFILTKNQPLWWDEAEYMSNAKLWAFNIPYDIDAARPPLFSFLAAIILKMGLPALAVKFILVLLPSCLGVFFLYKLVEEMYDKKIALISAFILSVSWIDLFYSARYMTDALGFLFGVLAIYAFWKGYVNNKGNYYIWLMGLFVGLSFLSRLTGILYGVLILIFVLLISKLKFLKNKHLWFAVLIFLLTISPYLIWANSHYGTPLSFLSGYGGPAQQTPPGYWMISLLYDYPELVFFILFLVGALTLYNLFISLDLTIIKEDKKLYNDLFTALNILFILLFFIYFLRLGENRWLMAMSIGIFILSAKGIILIYEIIKKNSKIIIGLLFILVILVSGAYFELNHADSMIKLKVDSYSQVRDAGIWLKQNSNPSDIIISTSRTQTNYYAERHVYDFATLNISSFQSLIDKTKPKYIQISAFEKTQDWFNQWVELNQKKLVPVNVIFADPQKQQPLLIIYAFNQTAS